MEVSVEERACPVAQFFDGASTIFEPEGTVWTLTTSQRLLDFVLPFFLKRHLSLIEEKIQREVQTYLSCQCIAAPISGQQHSLHIISSSNGWPGVYHRLLGGLRLLGGGRGRRQKKIQIIARPRPRPLGGLPPGHRPGPPRAAPGCVGRHPPPPAAEARQDHARRGPESGAGDAAGLLCRVSLRLCGVALLGQCSV